MKNQAHKYMTIANLYAGESCKLYTLNGIERARIAGRLCDFAQIVSLDSALSITVNRPTVERKMMGDKLFYSC